MTIVEAARTVTGGIDTHGDTHVAAVLDEVGGLLGTESFRVDPEGYSALLTWLQAFGDVGKVGVEGTGSYGAGIARFLARAGVHVVEVDRQNRQARHHSGKSDPLDAVEAARAVLSGRAQGTAKSRDGSVEAIRVLVVAKRSARGARIKALTQMRQLTFSAPDQLQSRLKGLPIAEFVAAAQGLRPTRSPDVVTAATKASLSSLAHRVADLEAEISDLDAMITPLLQERCARAARRLWRRHRHRGRVARRRRRQPRASPFRGRLGAPVRGLTARGLLGQGHSSPPQSGRGPPGQPGAVAHRDHPTRLRSEDPGLHGAPGQRRSLQARSHPHAQALRRPRGLPLPASRLDPWTMDLAHLTPVVDETDLYPICRSMVRAHRSRRRVT